MYWNSSVVNILHQERINEAAKRNRMIEMLGEHPEGHKSYNPALAWMGRRMMNIRSKIVQMSGVEEQSLN